VSAVWDAVDGEGYVVNDPVSGLMIGGAAASREAYDHGVLGAGGGFGPPATEPPASDARRVPTDVLTSPTPARRRFGAELLLGRDATVCRPAAGRIRVRCTEEVAHMDLVGLDVRNVANGLDIEVALDGQVDTANVATLVRRLTTLASRQPRQLRIDFGAVGVADDAMVRLATALLDLGAVLEAEGGHLVITGTSGVLSRQLGVEPSSEDQAIRT
jgi:anti-anti-sigma regulatory factor